MPRRVLARTLRQGHLRGVGSLPDRKRWRWRIGQQAQGAIQRVRMARIDQAVARINQYPDLAAGAAYQLHHLRLDKRRGCRHTKRQHEPRQHQACDPCVHAVV